VFPKVHFSVYFYLYLFVPYTHTQTDGRTNPVMRTSRALPFNNVITDKINYENTMSKSETRNRDQKVTAHCDAQRAHCVRPKMSTWPSLSCYRL